MAVLPLTRPLYAAPPAQQSPLYTCIGKGGRYEKVGSAKPAGIAHFEHNIGAVIVYRDIESDHLYFRLPLDFNRRMKRIDDGDTAAPEQAEQDALKVPRELKDGEFRDLVNELRDIACEYYGTEQLRERIAHALRRALLGGGE